MKKTLLIAALAGLTFAACKKDRTCTCTNSEISKTSTQPGYTYTPKPPTTSKTTYSKIKKGDVNAELCVSKEVSFTSNQTFISGSSTLNYVVTTTNKNECELTK